MTDPVNHLGQPIGFPLPGWSARARPPRTAMEGRFCRVEPIDVDRHAADLHAANLEDKEGRNWTYLAYGPIERLEDYRDWMRKTCLSEDPLFHAVIDLKTGRAAGGAGYLRIDPPPGAIQGRPINYAPPLPRPPAPTPPLFLLLP